MDWEAIGAIGETLGAIAVLVTLVYLAVQVRQNTAQQKREELVSIQHGQNAIVSQLQNPQVMGAYVRTAEERSPTIEDRGTCLCFVVQYLNNFQLVHELRMRVTHKVQQGSFESADLVQLDIVHVVVVDRKQRNGNL